MQGRITRLLEDRQTGAIAAEDGCNYVFASRSIIDVTFRNLHVGAAVSFTPMHTAERRAEAVRRMSK